MFSPILLSSLRVGVDTLRANPLRTLLSTLGIIMGVAALVAVLSLGDGVEQYARSQIERTTDLQMVAIAPRVVRYVDGQPFPNPDAPRFTLDDAAGLRTSLGDLAEVTMALSGTAVVRAAHAPDTLPHAARVLGVMANARELQGLAMVEGRFLSAEDVRGASAVAVASRALAEGLGLRLGDTLLVNGAPRAVVGIVEDDRPPATDSAARLAARVAYVPIGAAPATGGGVFPPQPTIYARARRVEQVDSARARAERWVASRFGGSWSDRVSIATNRARVAQVQQGMLVFKLLMGAFAGISLIVGGIGIMNVLLASVVERTREIGIRKATGARHRHILTQFLSESVVICTAGALLGVVLGLAGAYGVTAMMRSMTRAQVYAGVSASTVVVGVLASVIVGLTFGLYPALRAARLAPIEAMHQE